MENKHIQCLNTVIKYLSLRDIETMDKEHLFAHYGMEQSDLLVLLGNSILYTVELTAGIFKRGLAKEIMIVGGVGHSTCYLRDNIKKYSMYRGIETDGRSEAEILKDVLVKYFDIDERKLILESTSTNCGSNAREALRILRELGRHPKSLILIQDPTMQRRTYASFNREWESVDTVFINYAPFIPLLKLNDGKPEFAYRDILGLWDMDRFLSLVMGEIPRLRDDKNGYGPLGKGYIVHVDVPDMVLEAYENLRCFLGNLKR